MENWREDSNEWRKNGKENGKRKNAGKVSFDWKENEFITSTLLSQ